MIRQELSESYKPHPIVYSNRRASCPQLAVGRKCVLLNGLFGLLCLNYCMALNYDYLVNSEKVCSLPGGLTFLFRQESKQRTDQRRGAEEFPFDTLTLSFPVASEINRPLLWTPLPAWPCRFPVLVACRKLVLLYLVPTPTPVAKYYTR